MPNPDAIVSSTIRLEPSLDQPAAELLRAEGGLFVSLEGDRRVQLDPEDDRSAGFAEILDGLSQLKLPVYVEVDPDRSVITRLLIPLVSHVSEVRQGQEALEVELEQSHARHSLPRSNPDFEAFEGQLREAQAKDAPVVLTVDDAQEIIDVRAYTPRPEEGPTPPFPRTEPGKPNLTWSAWRKLVITIWEWPWWPWWWFGCVSSTRAQQIFDAMNATSCSPLAVPPPCIPFLYPDDGCWGRAHEMRRLMVNMGLSVKKVWIQGSLTANTKNNPNCHVNWGWHVAPTICVRGPGWFQSQRTVIDPSLFTTPVTKQQWKSVQGDANATLTDTPGSYFRLWGETDETYAKTNQVLVTYRLQLKNRSLGPNGPPPYAHCP